MDRIRIAKNILNERSDTLKCFLKDIEKYPIYSSEEQVKLAKLAQAGDKDAREKLITSNLRFVITCAKKYVNQGVSLIDLIQSGMEGLIISVDRFDPSRGYHFISFAVWYIRREILRAIYNTGRTIRYPITYITKITKVKKAYEDFILKYNREPTDDELINLTNLTQKQYDSTVMDKSYCVSINTPLDNDSDDTVESLLGDSSSDINIQDDFTKETIKKCLTILNPREYKVITDYYGINDEHKEASIREIADSMGIGDERVRQIRKIAIKKLLQKKGKTLEALL